MTMTPPAIPDGVTLARHSDVAVTVYKVGETYVTMPLDVAFDTANHLQDFQHVLREWRRMNLLVDFHLRVTSPTEAGLSVRFWLTDDHPLKPYVGAA